MTNEAKIASYFIRNALGTLNETEKEELEAWKQSSEANQQLFEQYNSAEQIALEFRNRTERNKRISGQLEQFVQEQPSAPARGRIHFMHKWKWIAASVVFVLGIGAYLLLENRNDPQQPLPPVSAARIQPGPRWRRSHTGRWQPAIARLGSERDHCFTGWRYCKSGEWRTRV